MINPGISAIEAGIRLTFLPYLNWKEFDRLNTDLTDRHKNSRSNPRQVPNYIQGWPDLIEYDPGNSKFFSIMRKLNVDL